MKEQDKVILINKLKSAIRDGERITTEMSETQGHPSLEVYASGVILFRLNWLNVPGGEVEARIYSAFASLWNMACK